MTNRAHDLEAEQSVIGGLMLDPDPADMADAFAALEVSAFVSPAHAAIFAAQLELFRDGVAIDEVTVGNKLLQIGKLKTVGGGEAVAEITERVPTAANIPYYVAIVRDAWQRRSLQRVIDSAARVMADPTKPVAVTAQELVTEVLALGERNSRGRLQSSRVLMNEVFNKLQADHEAGVDATGLPTGFYDIDQMLGGGMQDSELIVLAGRPSMGKSALAFEFALNAATRSDVTALVVSLEMGAASLMRRLLASRARIDGRCLRSPKKLRDADWPKLGRAMNLAATDKLQIVDQDGMTVDDIRAKARTCKARHGLGLVVVDYLQLMRPTMAKRERTREREVAEMSAALKGLAKELAVPVLCLAQLNRSVEGREVKKPRLSDLRESGSLEQDADVVLLVHRDAYYDDQADKSVAEVIVAKQRNGPTGSVTLGWEDKFSRFYNPQERQMMVSAEIGAGSLE